MKKAILIQSPARYFFFVPVFYKVLSKYKFFDKFYIASEVPKIELGPGCVHIKLKRYQDFVDTICRALPHIKEDVFFMSCVDHIAENPKRNTDWRKVNQCFDIICSNPRIGYIRLTRKKMMVVADERKLVSEYNGSCCASLTPGIWRKQFLRDILSGNSPWEFEKLASRRARAHQKMRCYCVNSSIYAYVNWMRHGVVNPNFQAYRERNEA